MPDNMSSLQRKIRRYRIHRLRKDADKLEREANGESALIDGMIRLAVARIRQQATELEETLRAS